jgi:hypothetical protein
MKTILSILNQVFLSRILALCLMTLLAFSGLLVFVAAPVYATTVEELKLVPREDKPTAEEKIERAYEMSEATGMLEETKQELADPNEYFDVSKKANTKTIIESSKSESQPGLVERAKELVEKITK